jgi:HSP20 family protein
MKLMPWKKKNNDVLRAGEGPSVLGLFRSEMNRLMDRSLERPWSLFDDEEAFLSGAGWAPLFDVLDGEKHVTVRAELPGVDPKDVEITVSGNVLTLSGEKKDSREGRERLFRRSERRYASFRRAVQLPEGVDAQDVTAEHVNGILTVKVGKLKGTAAKRIAVSVK